MISLPAPPPVRKGGLAEARTGVRSYLDTILEMDKQVGTSVTLIKGRHANIPHAEIVRKLITGF